MPTLDSQLQLSRCPHCNVDRPNLQEQHRVETTDYNQINRRVWKFYACARCGGIVTAAAPAQTQEVSQMFPEAKMLDESIPGKAKSYLEQALDSLHAPSGAIMLAASAIDDMLKNVGHKVGGLHDRLDQAAEANKISEKLVKWAHQIRLDPNDQKPGAKGSKLPEPEDARKTIDFALALAELLFVMPAKVQKGLKESK